MSSRQNSITSRIFASTSEKGFSPASNILLSMDARENKKAAPIAQNGLFNLILAVTYVPTQLPVQYHRPCEA
jgi:hypothetical protein